MDNFDIKEYIKGFPTELQAKAEACKTPDELLKLADENNTRYPRICLKWYPAAAVHFSAGIISKETS